jgi:hypothetical protein
VNQIKYNFDEKEYQKEYREQNKEKIKEYQENNKEKLKQYRENNKEKIKQYQKELNSYKNSWGGYIRYNNNLLKIDVNLFQ